MHANTCQEMVKLLQHPLMYFIQYNFKSTITTEERSLKEKAPQED